MSTGSARIEWEAFAIFPVSILLDRPNPAFDADPRLESIGIDHETVQVAGYQVKIDAYAYPSRRMASHFLYFWFVENPEVHPRYRRVVDLAREKIRHDYRPIRNPIIWMRNTPRGRLELPGSLCQPTSVWFRGRLGEW